MPRVDRRRERDDFSELLEQLKTQKDAEPAAVRMPAVMEQPQVSEVSAARRRRSSLMDNRKLRYVVSPFGAHAHDRDCPEVRDIPDEEFDMVEDFPESRWFCEKCYHRALIRKGLAQHEMNQIDRYCAVFQSFHPENKDLRRLMLKEDTKLRGVGRDYVELQASGEEWRIYAQGNECLLYRCVETEPGSPRMYRQDWCGGFGKVAFRITNYTLEVERNRRIQRQKALREQLDACINIKQLRRFSFFHEYYIYVDCIRRYQALSWEHGFAMEVKEIMEYPDTMCAVIICKIRRKYRKKLFAAMKAMKEWSTVTGCEEYVDFCNKNLPPDGEYVRSVILDRKQHDTK